MSNNKAFTVIVPFSRPAQSRHIADTLLAQTVRPARLLVCGNGEGVLGLKLEEGERLAMAGIEVVMLQLPEPNVCRARNSGLDYAAHMGFDWLAFLDDDDHYLPTYLERIGEYAAPNRIVGSRPHTVVDDRGVFRVHYEPDTGPCEWLSGGTHAFGPDVAKRLRYPIVPFGEDVMFCLLAHQIGIEVYDVGPGEFLYDRRGAPADHAWPRDARKHLGYFARTSDLAGELAQQLTRSGPEASDKSGDTTNV